MAHVRRYAPSLHVILLYYSKNRESERAAGPECAPMAHSHEGTRRMSSMSQSAFLEDQEEPRPAHQLVCSLRSDSNYD